MGVTGFAGAPGGVPEGAVVAVDGQFGLVAALIANIVLGACAYALYCYEPNVMTIITWRELLITALAVFLFGIIITEACSYISVNKFLRMSAGELYKI